MTFGTRCYHAEGLRTAPMLNPTILCPILIGRTAAIEVIDHAISALRTGVVTAHTMIVTGEAGIGKT